ncbi:alpha/beta hydrolase family protein [Micromonospora sp. CPCC 206061]|uniref:alpha/beta hydrolase family protein n=1 Tax=Micromonospora sp. CPCC 206061 TaxID=3122410 RepID=UPI002FF36816
MIRPLRLAVGVLASVLAAVAVTVPASDSAVAATRPVALPAPSGPFPVGMSRLHMIDASRTDPWVPPAGHRELMVSVWYPASLPIGRPAAYLTEREAAALAAARRLPLDPADVAAIRTSAGLDSPPRPAPRRHPLVVLSPGFSLPAATLTGLAEELASRGYVVAGIDHTYESSGVELPGGRLATCVACEKAKPVQVPPVRAADTSFVIDQLTRTRSRTWRGSWMIDPHRIGMAGHSIGGNSAAETMRTDPRVDAGVNMDGSFYTDLPPGGLDRPFLMLGEPGLHTPGDAHDTSWDTAWQLLTGWRRWFTVTGTAHMSFSDFAPLGKRFGLPSAPLDGDRIDQITRAYVAAFFDTHLRGIPRPILDGADPRYPEVIRHTP